MDFFSRRPSWRISSSGMVIMVFLCTFVLHICYISFLVIPTLFLRLHCFDVYWFNIWGVWSLWCSWISSVCAHFSPFHFIHYMQSSLSPYMWILHLHRFHHSHANRVPYTRPPTTRSISLYPYTLLRILSFSLYPACLFIPINPFHLSFIMLSLSTPRSMHTAISS